MNKFKSILVLFIAMLICLGSFTGCGKKDDIIRIWVGAEVREFYQRQVDSWVANYNSTNEKPFPYTVIVDQVDTGAAAARFLDDTDSGADMFTVAHDNLGRLIAGASAIGPITNPRLLAQITNDNPDIFHDIVKGSVGGVEYTFGVPYASQALVLYYNKDYLSEDDVKTWESVWARARAVGKQSVIINGDDGYNNSFLVLATRVSDGMQAADIYENKQFENCNFTSDLAVATMQWGQRFFTDASPDGRTFYGARRVGDSGVDVELANEHAISMIGGFWNLPAVRAALGSKLGITVLPTFTLTADDVRGTNIAAGTEMYSGTFADAQMFVMKKFPQGSEKADYVQELMMYLSSKEVQERAFNETTRIPSYKNATNEFAKMREDTIEVLLVRTQIEMFERGRPQPFGPNARMNNWYYSQGAPGIVLDILTDKAAYATTTQIRNGMAIVEHIWRTGRRPE